MPARAQLSVMPADARPPTRHRDHGPDRVGQDRARNRMGAATRRRNRQRRFGARLSRARHRQREARCGRARAGAATHARPARSARDLQRGGVRCRCDARHCRASRRAAGSRCWSAAPACISVRCCTGCRRCRRPMQRCARPSQKRAQRTAGMRCTPSWRRSIRPRPRASSPAIASASAARWKCGGSAAGRSATGRTRPGARRFRSACSSWYSLRPIARYCTGGSRRASTRCSPRASSTRCAGCAPIRACANTQPRWICRRCARSVIGRHGGIWMAKPMQRPFAMKRSRRRASWPSAS